MPIAPEDPPDPPDPPVSLVVLGLLLGLGPPLSPELLPKIDHISQNFDLKFLQKSVYKKIPGSFDECSKTLTNAIKKVYKLKLGNSNLQISQVFRQFVIIHSPFLHFQSHLVASFLSLIASQFGFTSSQGSPVSLVVLGLLLGLGPPVSPESSPKNRKYQSEYWFKVLAENKLPKSFQVVLTNTARL